MATAVTAVGFGLGLDLADGPGVALATRTSAERTFDGVGSAATADGNGFAGATFVTGAGVALTDDAGAALATRVSVERGLAEVTSATTANGAGLADAALGIEADAVLVDGTALVLERRFSAARAFMNSARSAGTDSAELDSRERFSGRVGFAAPVFAVWFSTERVSTLWALVRNPILAGAIVLDGVIIAAACEVAFLTGCSGLLEEAGLPLSAGSPSKTAPRIPSAEIRTIERMNLPDDGETRFKTR